MKNLKPAMAYIVIHCFLLFTFYPTVSLAYALPEMGDTAVRGLNRMQEQQLGAEIMLKIRESSLYNSDLIVTDYVQSLGARLVAASHRPAESFEFFVINDNRVNAFALPGGYIGINTGLILVAVNEDEVAGVMAHETAHVTLRHIARMFERSKSLSWPMMAALVASMVLASQNAALGSGAMAGTLAGSTQDMINFTRSNEEEADRVGMDMLSRAQFDPHSMATFFGRMAQANKYNDSFYVPDFLRTHPVNSARIADALSRAQNYPPHARSESLSFQLIKHRLQVLYGSPMHNSAAYYQTELEDAAKRTNPVWRYGYALALAKKKSYQEAAVILEQLVASNRNEKIYSMSLAEIYQEQYRYTEAISLLQQNLKLYPADEALTLQTARMMLNAKDYQQTKLLLEKQLRYAPKHPQYYYLLAQAEEKLNDLQASHMARAEYYVLQADLDTAIRELKRAQALDKSNMYEQAKISARLKKLEMQAALLED